MSVPYRTAVLACVLLFAAGCGNKPEPTPPPAPGGPPAGAPPTGPPAGAPAPAGTTAGWTLDVKALAPPDAPVAGRLGGQEFRPDKVEFDDHGLTFRQGKEIFAEREVKLMLPGDSVTREGLNLVVTPDKEFDINVPHVRASWKKPGAGLPETQMYMGKYALKLEFGKPAGGKVRGKIHLCLPDEAKSFLAGSFTVDAALFGGVRIEGTITIKGNGNQPLKLSASFLGQGADGKLHSGHCGFTVQPGNSGFVSSFGSRLESSETGVSFRHSNVPPGTYLVLLAWDDSPHDWRWVEVKGTDNVRADLELDLAALGELEVTLPAGAKEQFVTLLPLDKDGKLPDKAGRASALANQVGNYLAGARVQAVKGEDKVTFRGLRAGPYRVVADAATADATVKAGQTTKAALK